MAEGFLPKKGYFHLPKKSYARHDDDDEVEENNNRKRKNEEEDDVSNSKRSRVEDKKQEVELDGDDMFSDSSVDSFSSNDEEDDDDDDDEGDEYGDGFGDDLMGDMDDRKRLWSLTEVEREAILEERRMKREAFMENRRLRRELAKAEQDKKKGKRSRLKKVSRDSSSEEEAMDDDDEDYALSGEEEDDETERKKKTSSPQSEEEEEEEDTIPLTPKDVNRIRLTRFDIARYLDEPYFEKLVTGCYVRYLIGENPTTKKPTYRMMKINGLAKPYKRMYKMQGILTDTRFRLEMQGEEKPLKLDRISNSRITQKELDFFLNNERDVGNRIPRRDEIISKRKQVFETCEGHVYTDHEVNEMVRLRKERNKNKIKNYGVEILQIQEELQLALEQQPQSEDDVELNQKIEGLRQRLKYLEEEEKERKNMKHDDSIARMHAINQKNIKHNTAIAREIARKRLEAEKKNSSKK